MALETETTELETPEDTDNETQVINLIVEDGSCVLSANCYVSLQEAIDYQFARNRTDWLALSVEEQKASLIRATQYVDNLFTWKGRRKYQSQVLHFPRVMLRDLDGFDVENIPQRLKDAVCEASFYGYQTELFSTYQNDKSNVKRDLKEVSGAVKTEVEYFTDSESSIDFISKYAALDSILRGLYYEKNRKTVNSRADWGL